MIARIFGTLSLAFFNISVVMKTIRTLGVALGISIASASAYAMFTTSEFGKGGFSDGSSVGNILNNFLGQDNAQQISLSELSSLATALASADSYDYSSSPTLSLFDSNNDGEISEQEFVDILNNISELNNVDTSGDGKYAQAYATELAAMTSPVTLTQMQSAITTGNTYAVDAPQIPNTSFSFSALNSSNSSSLGLIDGLGNTLDNASLINSFSAQHSNGSNASDNFTLTSNGSIELASGVNIEDLTPGTYTFSVTSTDSNSLSYELSTTTDVSLTLSNAQGCVVTDDVTSADFTTNADASTSIDGATVTINGNHSEDDLLFVKGATSSSTSDNVSYTGLDYGITGFYDKDIGQMTFSGSTTEANWINIFKKVGYIYDNTSSPDNGTRSLIFSLSSNIVYNHTDGADHFYKFISNDGINFDDAFAAADNSTLFGMQGYLVTITSAAEQAYIVPKLKGAGWIGGCDRLGDATVQGHCRIDNSTDLDNLVGVSQSEWDNTTGTYSMAQGEGYFYWVTGPERLEFITQDIKNCNSSSDPDKQRTYPTASTCNHSDSLDSSDSNYPYTNFQYTEPNNYRHDGDIGENYLHVHGTGLWNDWRLDGDTTTSGNAAKGYIVEYGGMDNETVPDLTVDKSYTIATDGQFCAYSSS